MRRGARTRTGGDDDERRTHAHLDTIYAAHRQLVSADETRAAPQQRDAVALELRRHVRVVRGDRRADAIEQRLDRLVEEIHLAHALAQRMFAQRLAGDRAPVHARAADFAVAFYDRHAPAGLRGLDRRLLPGRAGADDDEVV